MRTSIFTILLLLLFTTPSKGATIDTLAVESPKMGKAIPVIVVTPSTMEQGKLYPVVYLLHGYSDDAALVGHKQWLTTKPELPQIADDRNLIFVCPNASTSWYWDVPNRPDMQYETFICQELISYIDAHYPTIASREGRAVSGLSMGGQGALWCVTHHPDLFGAAGSTSGGVDICSFPDSKGREAIIGSWKENKATWEHFSVINYTENLKDANVALIIDCGYDDSFFESNNKLHGLLMKHGVPHDYIVRPGGHEHSYWNNAIDYHIEFFCKIFDNTAVHQK